MNWSKIRLMPKSEDFIADFEEAIRNVLKGTYQFKDLLSNYSQLENKVKQIAEIEHQGDKITHKTIEKLNRTFVTQMDREDIHSLICGMDDILDLVDAVARKMLLYKIGQPTEETKKLTEILIKSVEEIGKAVPFLRGVSNPQNILQHCIEVNSLENEGDQVMRAAVAKLFEEAKDPIQVIKWKEIYENLETAIDRCEDVANILEGIMLKYS